MLAELAAINAAFAIIKETVANGRDLANAGSAINDFVNAKEDLQVKHSKKKNSLLGNDFKEFMALEEVRKKEKDLQSWMQLYGRAGLWQDWVKFQAEARRARQKELERRRRRRAEIMEIVGVVSMMTVIAVIIIVIMYVVARKKLWL